MAGTSEGGPAVGDKDGGEKKTDAGKPGKYFSCIHLYIVSEKKRKTA